MFIVRLGKLCVFSMYMLCRSFKGYGYSTGHIRFIMSAWPRTTIFKTNFFILKVIALSFFNRYFIVNRSISVIYNSGAIGMVLDALVALAWMCEKMNINMKIQDQFSQHISNITLFDMENRLGYTSNSLSENYYYSGVACLGRFFISSEYGYKILSKLSIKESIKDAADKWSAEHIRGNWIAVHYRGTDIERDKNSGCERRYRIELDNYVVYLKSVLNNQCNIFVCSDQQQFIDKMHETFRGRVFSRDIQRSHDDRALHQAKEYIGIQQQQDALIDMLILAKAELIYTTGSSFVDAVRYFNPQIKIVSVDGRRIGRGKNNIPIPKKALLDKLSRSL